MIFAQGPVEGMDGGGLRITFFGITPWQLVGIGAALLAVTFFLRMVLRKVKEVRNPISEGEVTGVVGRPGAGKTLFAVRLAHRRLMAGAHVATNFSMALPPKLAGRWRHFGGWDDLIELEDCVIILDEAHLMAPSGTQFKLSELASWKLSQVRRFGCELIWISQNEMRVSKEIRDLTSYIWVCKQWRKGKGVFSAVQYEPEHLRKPEFALDKRRWRWDQTIGDLYDSWELLPPKRSMSEHDQEKRILAMVERRNADRRRALATAPAASASPSAEQAAAAATLHLEETEPTPGETVSAPVERAAPHDDPHHANA